jgi:hypothetical protein
MKLRYSLPIWVGIRYEHIAPIAYSVNSISTSMQSAHRILVINLPKHKAKPIAKRILGKRYAFAYDGVHNNREYSVWTITKKKGWL